MSNGRKYEKPCTYQIKVNGSLSADWSTWFEDFQISPQQEGTTLLTGEISDQAALHGLLARIANLGLPLLSLTRLESSQAQTYPVTHFQGEAPMATSPHPGPGENPAKFENRSTRLWLEQISRRIQGKPLLQEAVLAKVLDQHRADENLLGILLFGSLAAGNHTWKSDIDLILIYQAQDPPAGMTNLFVEGIAVQYFFCTLQNLVENQQAVPYLLHMFSEATILFDRHGTVGPVLDQLQGYFAAHPEVAEDWARFKREHSKEKNGPECAQTTILQRWDELEDKYSGGSRKRSFFIF